MLRTAIIFSHYPDMKKNYQQPLVQTISLRSEGIIATSLGIGTTPGGGMGTQKKKISEDWSDYEEVEEAEEY